MLQNFSKYAGLVQLALGLLGQFAPELGGDLMGAHTGAVCLTCCPARR